MGHRNLPIDSSGQKIHIIISHLASWRQIDQKHIQEDNNV